MAVDHVLMLPAIHLSPSGLVGEAPRAKRTDTTDRLEGRIADMLLAGAIFLVARHRPQLSACRAAVDVPFRVVDEVLHSEAALLHQPTVLLGFRHIGSDRVRFA